MSIPAQKFFTWCGPIFVVIFFAGMLCAGLLPPHGPSDTPQEVVDHWAQHEDLRRLGIFLMMIAAGFTGPFVAVISVQLKRIEPEGAYSNLQLIGGACGVIAILVPTFIFGAAAFRPEDRSEDVMLALNDLAWIPFVMNFPPALMQCLAIGFATLGDKTRTPVFPRWFGYYQLWTAFLFLPGGLIIFFKHGAFGWNGALAFWVVAVVFGAWFIVNTVMLLKAIKQTEPKARKR